MINVINPARFSEVVGQVPESSEGDVDRALGRAEAAFKIWSRVAPAERASRLREVAGDLGRAQPELARLFVRENGKPLQEAETEIRRSIELMEVVAAALAEWSKPVLIEPHQPVWARRRPRGVTAVISPWNSPILLSFKRLVPAIASGNTVVVKPSSYCPLALIECADIFNRYFPEGVLQVITGSGTLAGEMLATDPRVQTVAFTGSTETGRRIMELGSRTVKKVFLELGGNDPAIILADAKLGEEAVARLTHAILRASGQVCIAIKRIYVHQSRFDELMDKLVESFDEVVVGDGLAPDSTMGPINNRSQFDFVSALLDKCVEKNMVVLRPGRKLSESAWDQGFFLLPAIVLGAAESDDVVRCEQFGPVIPIMPFEDEEDAIARANDTAYGLRASVWTEDRERAEGIADRLQAGAVFLNNHSIFRDLNIEFPGIKQSGFSRDSRSAGLDHYADAYGFAE